VKAWIGIGLALGTLVGCGSSSSSGSAAATAAATSSTAPTTSSATGIGGTSSTSATNPLASIPPVLTGASEAEGFNDRDQTVVLSGSGFFRGAVVRLAGATPHLAIQVDVQTENRIEAVLPAGAELGSYTFEVETAGGVAQGPSYTVRNLLDVDEPGAFEVGYEDRKMTGASGDQVDVRVYYPALTKGRATAADPSAGPYPVVVYSHGFKPFLLAAGIDYRNNTFLVETLASFGYVVVCPDLSSNNVYFGSNGTGQANSQRDAEDALAAIDFAALLGQDPAHPLFALVDEDRAGLAGHSRGADGSLIAAADEVVARGAQARVKAVVAFAPPATDSQNSNAPLQFGDFSSVPTFLVGASEDSIAPLSDQQDILALAGPPSWLFEISGGNHSQYKDSASRILSDGSASIPLADQQAICRRYATAWLHRHVKGLDLPAIKARILQGSEVVADTRITSVTIR
jgi:predicted dienelactone hydrolase